MSDLHTALLARADNRCELCGTTEGLEPLEVGPGEASADRAVLACELCRGQAEPEAKLDAKHWFCLQEAAWSEVAAVQVFSWRMLGRLTAESWASDLLDQLYLDDETLAWAQQRAEPVVRVVDSHGTVLADGDTVTLIKDLDVKGGGFTAKRGTTVKNIRLSDDPTHIEGRVGGVAIYLKTSFLKRLG